MYYLSEVSQVVLNLANHISDIYQHFKDEYPKEACGVLCVRKGKLHWVPCDNVSDDPENGFVIDSRKYLKLSMTSDIVGIVHSHPDASCEPSEHDINACNSLGIPYYIYNFPDMDLHILQPTNKQKPLMGREYKFGVSDCYEAAKDWYRENGIDAPFRDAYEDDWWLKGLNYFTNEHLASKGWYPQVDAQKGDLLVFSVDSKVPNHCGVYLGRDIFYHHAQNRLSCRENLYPFWVKYLTGIYRYDAQSIS